MEYKFHRQFHQGDEKYFPDQSWPHLYNVCMDIQHILSIFLKLGHPLLWDKAPNLQEGC